MSDYDLESIIAFLRSDHPAVQASKDEPPKSDPSFLTKMLTRTVIKAFDYPSGPIPHPDTTDPVLFGEYLVDVQLGCFQCHSADFKTNNDLKPRESEGYLGGGNVLYDMDGNKVLSPNITMGQRNRDRKLVRIRFYASDGTIKNTRWPDNEISNGALFLADKI